MPMNESFCLFIGIPQVNSTRAIVYFLVTTRSELCSFAALHLYPASQ